jgi:hypothetical protein
MPTLALLISIWNESKGTWLIMIYANRILIPVVIEHMNRYLPRFSSFIDKGNKTRYVPLVEYPNKAILIIRKAK